METYNDFIVKAKKEFPDLKFIPKADSALMKVIGIILFFNKSFMTSYITTLGNTIYTSSTWDSTPEWYKKLIVIHEMTHMYDSKNNFFFKFLYLMPQILALLSIPLFFLSWKIALPVLIFFLLPLPAYFRKKYELRAYLTEFYAWNKDSNDNFKTNLENNKKFLNVQFKGFSYYCMWIFGVNIDSELELILDGKKPFKDDELFKMVDRLTDR